MKIAYTIKQKTKIATLLFAVMACTILIRILEDKSVESMNRSFVSLYQDRLIPATDLFYIAEHVYAKKYALDGFLYGAGADVAALKREFGQLNGRIDVLLQKYERTFLVKSEQANLLALKQQLGTVKHAEQQVMIRTAADGLAAGRLLHETSGREASKNALDQLNELIRIQTQVGAELIDDSAFMASRSKFYSVLQITLAVFIGVFIVAIISASNVVNIRSDKFNLN